MVSCAVLAVGIAPGSVAALRFYGGSPTGVNRPSSCRNWTMSSLAWGIVINLLKIGSAPALIRSAEHNGGQNLRDDTVAPHPGQPKRYSILG